MRHGPILLGLISPITMWLSFLWVGRRNPTLSSYTNCPFIPAPTHKELSHFRPAVIVLPFCRFLCSVSLKLSPIPSGWNLYWRTSHIKRFTWRQGVGAPQQRTVSCLMLINVKHRIWHPSFVEIPGINADISWGSPLFDQNQLSQQWPLKSCTRCMIFS